MWGSRRGRAVTALAATAVVAAGCGAPGESGSPAGAGPAATIAPPSGTQTGTTQPGATQPGAHSKADPVISVIPLPASNLGPLPSLPASEAGRFASVAWSLVGSGPGDQVSVSVSGDGCLHLEGSEVEARSDTVTVAVLADKSPSGGAGCAAEQVTVLAAVRLPQPLGGRTLLHAPTS